MSLGQSQADNLLLAWLSDPATFKLNLKIESTNGGIRVVGCVPNDSVRKRVMEIASKTTGGLVQDGLQSVPGMLPGFSETLTAQQLHDRVQEMIQARVPNCAQQIEIHTDHLGRVTLMGQVNTLKDVLHICQCLRQIPQCNGVVNRLSLGGFTQPNQMPVAKKVSPSVQPGNIPVVPETKTLPNQLTMENSSQNPPQTPWTGKTSWTPTPFTKTSQGQSGSSTDIPPLPAPGNLPVANKIIQYDLGQPYEAIALVSLAKEDSPMAVKTGVPVAPMKKVPDLQPVNFQTQSIVSPLKSQATVPPLPQKGLQEIPPIAGKTPTVAVPPVPNKSTTVVVSQSPTKPVLPTIPPMPTKPATAEVTPVTGKPATAPVPSMPTKLVSSPVPPMPTKAVPSAPVQPKQLVNNSVAPTLPKNCPSPAQVKWLVEKHCGSKARNVMVRYMENGKMEIRLQVQQESHAPAIFEQIVRINELSAYQIKLKVEIAH